MKIVEIMGSFVFLVNSTAVPSIPISLQSYSICSLDVSFEEKIIQINID